VKVAWSDPAIDDLAAIREYIEEHSPSSAARVLRRLVEAVDPLEQFPRMGRAVPEAAGSRRPVLELLVDDYRVLYEVEEHRVLILAIAHGRQLLSALGTKPWER
jgi:addiction module RelE/StbE family toxin